MKCCTLSEIKIGTLIHLQEFVWRSSSRCLIRMAPLEIEFSNPKPHRCIQIELMNPSVPTRLAHGCIGMANFVRNGNKTQL